MRIAILKKEKQIARIAIESKKIICEKNDKKNVEKCFKARGEG